MLRLKLCTSRNAREKEGFVIDTFITSFVIRVHSILVRFVRKYTIYKQFQRRVLLIKIVCSYTLYNLPSIHNRKTLKINGALVKCSIVRGKFLLSLEVQEIYNPFYKPSDFSNQYASAEQAIQCAHKDYTKQTWRRYSDHFIWSMPSPSVLFFFTIEHSVIMALLFY